MVDNLQQRSPDAQATPARNAQTDFSGVNPVQIYRDANTRKGSIMQQQQGYRPRDRDRDRGAGTKYTQGTRPAGLGAQAHILHCSTQGGVRGAGAAGVDAPICLTDGGPIRRHSGTGQENKRREAGNGGPPPRLTLSWPLLWHAPALASSAHPPSECARIGSHEASRLACAAMC